MSALDRVRREFNLPISGTDKTDKSPSGSSVSSQDKEIENLGAGNEISNSLCRELTEPTKGVANLDSRDARARRQTVEAMLAKRPELQRAAAFEEGPEHVAVTIATRDGQFTEMTIPRSTWNRADFFRLVDELDGETH